MGDLIICLYMSPLRRTNDQYTHATSSASQVSIGTLIGVIGTFIIV